MAIKAPSKSSRKILIVDDDADWRELVKLHLDDLGYQSVQASTGEQALSSMAKEDCSVMLLDMHMPGMTGEEVLSKLPPKDPPRVVFLTASPAQDIHRALARGAHYYLPKGAALEQLSLILEALEA